MSTRAIIGIKNPDGSILGAWQWNDGDCIINDLNRNFNTAEKARLLISQGMWSTMFTKTEMECYEKWLVKDLYKGNEAKIPQHSYTEVCGVYLLKYPHHDGKGPETYSDFEEASGQDINHIFLFNPETSKWTKDKDL